MGREMEKHTDAYAWFKVFVAWVGAFFGAIELSHIAILSTIVFTVFQTFFLLRDKWWRDPVRKRRQAARRRLWTLKQ